MNALRRWIVDDFEKGAGRHDEPDIYGGPPGDPGLIGPGSMSWEINADLASVSQAGLPAIVLEILHPSVIAGVQDLSNYREDPFQRARATLGYVLATTFGNTEAATSVIERVKHIHSFVNGTRPDGVPYRALDPELLAWVHTCIPWMILRVYEATKRPLSQHEKDRYLSEQAVIGRMGGADWVPTTAAELDDYIETMRPRLSVNAQTREFVDFLMTSPFFPNLPERLDRQLHRFAIYAGMSRAPRWAQETHRIRPAACGDARPDGSDAAFRCRAPALGVRHTALPANGPGPGGRNRAFRGRRVVIDAQLIEVVGGASAGSRVDERGRPHQCPNPGRRADRGCRRWAATHHGRGRGSAGGRVADDGLPPLPAARRSGRGAGAPGDATLPRPPSPTPSTASADPNEGVAEAFIAAVSFARAHPMLRRAGEGEPAPIADSVELLKMGSAFIANYIHGEERGTPSQQVRWVADVFARLFFTYISMPPSRSRLRGRRRTAAVRARGPDPDGGSAPSVSL